MGVPLAPATCCAPTGRRAPCQASARDRRRPRSSRVAVIDLRVLLASLLRYKIQTMRRFRFLGAISRAVLSVGYEVCLRPASEMAPRRRLSRRRFEHAIAALSPSSMASQELLPASIIYAMQAVMAIAGAAASIFEAG